MSVMCSRPSSPPRSTNAPYSVRFFTTPVRTEPSSRCSSVLLRFSLCSPSSNSLRETTILPRFLLSLMTVTSSVWPFMPSRFRMGRRSTCDPGRKARAPRMSTVRPPLAVSFLHLVPGVNARRLLVREVDVAFLGVSLLAHHINFVARLYLRLAFVIQHFREGQHAFRLGAHIHYNVGGSQFE